MEHLWDDNDNGRTDLLGAKPAPLPLYLPQIPHGLAFYNHHEGETYTENTDLHVELWTRRTQLKFAAPRQACRHKRLEFEN